VIIAIPRAPLRGMAMNISIDFSSALAHASGVSRYVRELTTAIAAAHTSGGLSLVHNRQPMDRLPLALAQLPRRTIDLSNKAWRLLLLFGARRVTERALNGLSVDIFHGPDCLLPSLQQPGVITIHDLTVLSHPQFHAVFNRLYQRLALPIMVRRARRVIADSSATRDEIIKRLDVDATKIDVIPLAIDRGRFRHIDQTIARQKVRDAIGVNERYVLGVGTLEPRKNLLTLVNAFLSLPAEHFPRLVLAGARGWGAQLPESLIASREFQSRVTLAGFMSDDLLPNLYAGADIFVYPSWAEGFGFPILEAMACGTPVITSDVSSMPEVAGGAALLFPPSRADALASAMMRITTDDQLRSALIHSGYDRAAQFSWQNTARATLDTYRAAIAGA
jgi:glycosyltransferase involved in cell wall biosynthesis